MGDLWRHPKVDNTGDAALGLLARIWSYCADQGVDTITEKRMLNLFRGSHGRKQLNELIASGFIDALPEGGYAPPRLARTQSCCRKRYVCARSRTRLRRTYGEPTANLRRTRPLKSLRNLAFLARAQRPRTQGIKKERPLRGRSAPRRAAKTRDAQTTQTKPA